MQGTGGTKSVLVVEQTDGKTCHVELQRPLEAAEEEAGGKGE